MNPQLNSWEYVFCCVKKIPTTENIIMLFKEQEWYTLILEKQQADILKLSYDWTMSWITLHIHSSLEAVWLTAAFSNALWNNNISCNVVAWYYHDHIFVWKSDAEQAINILRDL